MERYVCGRVGGREEQEGDIEEESVEEQGVKLGHSRAGKIIIPPSIFASCLAPRFASRVVEHPEWRRRRKPRRRHSFPPGLGHGPA